MTFLAAITAAFEAFASLAKAFPLWLQWQVTKECESLTEKIIDHENKGTPADRSIADRLRSNLAYRRQLNATLQSRHTGA
jgi:hypothetical protein